MGNLRGTRVGGDDVLEPIGEQDRELSGAAGAIKGQSARRRGIRERIDQGPRVGRPVRRIPGRLGRKMILETHRRCQALPA